MIELPASPSYELFLLTGLLPIFIGAFISWRLNEKNYDFIVKNIEEKHNDEEKYGNFTIFLPMIIGAIIVTSSMIFFSIESNEYKIQMVEIIETSDCSDLVSIAHEVNSYYRGLIVDEVVIRCLSDQDPDPVMMLLLSEVRG